MACRARAGEVLIRVFYAVVFATLRTNDNECTCGRRVEVAQN